VDIGAQVSTGVALASLVGTDEYWIELSVPVDELRWIGIPGFNSAEGSPARVYHEAAWRAGTHRPGRVVRLMTDIEPEGRMARLLVSVEDPLLLNGTREGQPLILGSYVRVEVEGAPLAGVFRVPRTAVHNGNEVWVMNPEGLLDIRTVRIAWSGNEEVYVSDGLEDGEQIVTSDLAAPVQGMALRTADSAPQPPRPSHKDDRP